jgi:hypothetical protein
LSKDVQYPHHANLPADKTRVTGQVLGGCRRDAKEQIINDLLMASSHVPESAGQGDCDQEVTHGQEYVLLLLQPLLRLAVLTLGTMVIPARVVMAD